MKYYQTTFTLTPYSEEACDILTALLAETGYETFLPTPSGIVAYVQQTAYDEAAVRRLTADFILPHVGITFQTAEAPDEDWNRTWEEETFAPIVLGNTVAIHSTRHSVPPCRYDIVINPRMAFGTGTHPTTQQILRQLTTMDLRGRRVVDAGCGTGVLGILAILCGANYVMGYDIDEWSVENARENSRINGLAHAIDIREGDVGVLPTDGSYDLLIANINRNILLADMAHFAAALNPRGELLLSGFYENDSPLLVERGRELGFSLLRQTVAEGWAMLLLRREG